ncbi:hypothetical protein LJB96_04130 [Methanobrevibacter sp. OttesenSCG-928-K11]|nr:hypothetical protein [Methanobrevibacter sp. OttesenSCG-928-K11]
MFNDLIKKGLESQESNKVKSRIINDELPKSFSKSENINIKDLAGFIKVNTSIDMEELINDIHFRQ